MNEFVEFTVNNQARFAALCRVFEALKHDKDSDSFRSDNEWLALFDKEALAHFWWPTAQELEQFRKKWEAIPWQERGSDQALQKPWDFNSMIDAFKNGEYDLLACRLVSTTKARLEFRASAWPYGGTECMKVLIEAFDFKVMSQDDGIGPNE